MRSVICRSTFAMCVFLFAVRVEGGPVDPPFVFDTFPSAYSLTLTALPAWTGLANPVVVGSVGQGPTTVRREVNAFLQAGRDTIDTEIVSMNLVGVTNSGLPGVPITIRAGLGNGIFPNLPASLGQVSEQTAVPNGSLDVFPANSFFDVFFDVWVDLNGNTTVEFGEVLRNYSAVTLTNNSLDSLPPQLDGTDVYISGGGTLFIANLNGSSTGIQAATIAAGNASHTPNPEPVSLSVLAMIGTGAAAWYRRRRGEKSAGVVEGTA